MPIGCDENPLAKCLILPRLNPSSVTDVAKRLNGINFESEPPPKSSDPLLVFYHPTTLQKINSIRGYLKAKKDNNTFDWIDAWIEMVAVSRLTGHSKGFFSVYTLPPNQAVTLESQKKINAKLNQVPEPRDVPTLILKKSRSLLSDPLQGSVGSIRLSYADYNKNPLHGIVIADAAKTHHIPKESVSLVVTSPPFLDVVDYATDNWLRCWFTGIDLEQVTITVPSKLKDWREHMSCVFTNLYDALKGGGYIAFEVGDVRGGKVNLDETVVPCGVSSGLSPLAVLVNSHSFTKTSNCWGVVNNKQGTNTNRVVLFQKPPVTGISSSLQKFLDIDCLLHTRTL